MLKLRSVVFGFSVLIGLAINNNAGAWIVKKQIDPANYFVATATASFRPVDIPGTQRRVAQDDAEKQARQVLLNHIGSLRLQNGQTINALLMKDQRLKASIFEVIRKAEVQEAKVSPHKANVQVWVRVDKNEIWGIINGCGY